MKMDFELYDGHISFFDTERNANDYDFRIEPKFAKHVTEEEKKKFNEWLTNVFEKSRQDETNTMIDLSKVEEILHQESSCISDEDVPKITDALRTTIGLPPQYESCGNEDCFRMVKITIREADNPALCDECSKEMKYYECDTCSQEYENPSVFTCGKNGCEGKLIQQ